MIFAILHFRYYAYIDTIFHFLNNAVGCFGSQLFWFLLYCYEICFTILLKTNSFFFVLPLIKGVNLRLFHITENY